MLNVCEAVKNGSSIKRATEEYGVPRLTPQGWILGNVEHRKKPGWWTYSIIEEQKDLLKFIEVASI